MIYVIAIGIFVMWMLYKLYVNFSEEVYPVSEKFTHSSLLEIVWTIIPALILMLIAVPSFGLLYSLDELIDPTVTLKVVGHQWYWSYEYSDYATLENPIVFVGKKELVKIPIFGFFYRRIVIMVDRSNPESQKSSL